MSGDHDGYGDDVAAYALGVLTELEAIELERHLQRCEACTRDVERFRAVVETLSMGVAPRTARRQLKQEVLQRIRESEDIGPSRPSRRKPFGDPRPRRPALAATGILAALALVIGGYGLGSSASGDSRQQLRATVDRATVPGASATLERAGDLGVLRTSNLAPLEEGVYVVWVDRGAGATFASSFNVGSGRSADAGILSLEGVKRMVVTQEATPRAPRPTRRPILTVQVQ